MAKKSMDDYLQQGIHGAKEINPDERRRFLGTLRERVVVALTQGEVRRKKVEPELKRILVENKDAHLYLNGNMNYSALSKYINAAEAIGNAYTIVTNKEFDSQFGLVVAYDYAIDKGDITLPKKINPIAAQSATGNKGLVSFMKTLFRK